MKDPYQALGIGTSATTDEIKNAYRNLAKKWHPDLNPGQKAAEERFKEISAAYELIGTPEAKARFDRGEADRGSQEPSRPFYHHTQRDGGRYASSSGGRAGEEDLFEQLFRAAGSSRRGAGERHPDLPGEDHLYQMTIDFKEAALGALREITLPNGKRLQVKIPPGIEPGTKLRFKNQGGPGIGQGPAGDAYVEIAVRPLAGFHRAGPHVETEVDISFIEALLGAEIQVPTLEGSVMLKIPPGVTTGSRLRIRGKGIGGAERGDQIVALKIKMPSTPNPGLVEAVRAWEGRYAYDPREEK